MIFGTIKSIVEPEILVNGQILEIVDTFKFLGVHIERKGNPDKHIKIRRTAFLSGFTEIENLGIGNNDAFELLAKSLPYSVLKKYSDNLLKSNTKNNINIVEFKNQLQHKINIVENTTPLNITEKKQGVQPIEIPVCYAKN